MVHQATASLKTAPAPSTPSRTLSEARPGPDRRTDDAYVAHTPKPRRFRAKPQAAALRQGEQAARKDIGGTIMNDIFFGFFASCGAALFGCARGACCR